MLHVYLTLVLQYYIVQKGISNFIEALTIDTYDLAIIFLLNFLNEIYFELLIHIVLYEDQYNDNSFKLISFYPRPTISSSCCKN